jgi:hypothetical protein
MHDMYYGGWRFCWNVASVYEYFNTLSALADLNLALDPCVLSSTHIIYL